MADKVVLIGVMVGGQARHTQVTWNPGDRLINPDGVSLTTEVELQEVAESNAGATPPTSPADGMFWLDSSLIPHKLKIYEGGDWRTLVSFDGSTSEPIYDGGTF